MPTSLRNFLFRTARKVADELSLPDLVPDQENASIVLNSVEFKSTLRNIKEAEEDVFKE